MFKEEKITNPILKKTKRKHVIKSCCDLVCFIAENKMRAYSRSGGKYKHFICGEGARICLKKLK